MKKIVSIICIITILILMLGILTGCGNKSNTIVDSLNEVVKEEVTKWKERGYGRTFVISFIQSGLDSKDVKYKIVASGNSKFSSIPDFKEYKESNISGYEGESYSQTRMMEKAQTVNYLVVYDSENNKYYNVEISYETENLNGTEKEYPVFENVTELK